MLPPSLGTAKSEPGHLQRESDLARPAAQALLANSRFKGLAGARCRTLVMNFIFGGTNGYELSSTMSMTYSPPSYGVSLGPGTWLRGGAAGQA